MTMIDALEALFKSRPGEWIDGRVLAEVGGCYAWRSRCSDLRRQRGLTIENRQRRVRTAAGEFVCSEYRFVPRRPVDLIEIAESTTTEATC